MKVLLVLGTFNKEKALLRIITTQCCPTSAVARVTCRPLSSSSLLLTLSRANCGPSSCSWCRFLATPTVGNPVTTPMLELQTKVHTKIEALPGMV